MTKDQIHEILGNDFSKAKKIIQIVLDEGISFYSDRLLFYFDDTNELLTVLDKRVSSQPLDSYHGVSSFLTNKYVLDVIYIPYDEISMIRLNIDEDERETILGLAQSSLDFVVADDFPTDEDPEENTELPPTEEDPTEDPLP